MMHNFPCHFFFLHFWMMPGSWTDPKALLLLQNLVNIQHYIWDYSKFIMFCFSISLFRLFPGNFLGPLLFPSFHFPLRWLFYFSFSYLSVHLLLSLSPFLSPHPSTILLSLPIPIAPNFLNPPPLTAIIPLLFSSPAPLCQTPSILSRWQPLHCPLSSPPSLHASPLPLCVSQYGFLLPSFFPCFSFPKSTALHCSTTYVPDVLAQRRDRAGMIRIDTHLTSRLVSNAPMCSTERLFG